MRKKSIFAVLIVILLVAFQRTEKDPWSDQQLMLPATLAAKINKGGNGPVIFNIGPSGKIKSSVHIGPTQDEAGMDKLKANLGKLPRNTEVVIYCGCCPFKNCPNIRPAFALLKEMKFTNAYLLDIPKNLKVDWIDKGYPMQR
jgi:thiosulfate/3-mercaptopyruvate sulfurtransferase